MESYIWIIEKSNRLYYIKTHLMSDQDDQDLTHEDLERIKDELQAFRTWLKTFSEHSCTIEELTESLASYLDAYLFYYSNKPGQVAEKQQRLFKIQSRLNTDLFERQKEFAAELASSEKKKELLKSAIARYEFPFIAHGIGIYYNGEVDLIISNVLGTMLSEGHSPYFEFVFDGNLVLTNRGAYDFFLNVCFLTYLREELKKIAPIDSADKQIHTSKSEPGKKIKKDVESFEDLFWDTNDMIITIRVMQRLRLLYDDESFVDVLNNRKKVVVLMDFLQKTPSPKIIKVKESLLARLLGERFNLSITERYLRERRSKSEEIVKDIEQCWNEESVKVSS